MSQQSANARTQTKTTQQASLNAHASSAAPSDIAGHLLRSDNGGRESSAALVDRASPVPGYRAQSVGAGRWMKCCSEHLPPVARNVAVRLLQGLERTFRAFESKATHTATRSEIDRSRKAGWDRRKGVFPVLTGQNAKRLKLTGGDPGTTGPLAERHAL